MVEPWLRGTLTAFDAVRRQVLHSLELVREDADRWCGDLTSAEIEEKPLGLPSVCFHLRHLTRSLDRLLTYAEGRQLTSIQLELLATEMDCTGAGTEAILGEFHMQLELSARRVGAINPSTYEEARAVGRHALQTTVGGLLVHCADHSQRHIGQAVTTAQVVRALSSKPL